MRLTTEQSDELEKIKLIFADFVDIKLSDDDTKNYKKVGKYLNHVSKR